MHPSTLPIIYTNLLKWHGPRSPRSPRIGCIELPTQRSKMKTITLHGELGQLFGESWSLDVSSPAEVIRALSANCPGFIKHLADSQGRGVAYRVLLDERTLGEDDIAAPFSQEHIHLVPVVVGAGSGKGVAGIILGAALIYASGGLGSLGGTVLFGSTTVASVAGNIGVSLVIGGLASVLVGTPKQRDISASDSPAARDSYNFSGPANGIAQGGAVPIGYGRVLCGSQRISLGITTEDFVG